MTFISEKRCLAPLRGCHSRIITDQAIDTFSSLKIKYVKSQKSREHFAVVLNVLSPSKSLNSKYQVVFAKTFNETEFCFVLNFWKNHLIFRLKIFTGFLLLIFCDFTHFIFNKLQTVSIARSVMVGLCHPVKVWFYTIVTRLLIHVTNISCTRHLHRLSCLADDYSGSLG